MVHDNATPDPSVPPPTQPAPDPTPNEDGPTRSAPADQAGPVALQRYPQRVHTPPIPTAVAAGEARMPQGERMAGSKRFLGTTVNEGLVQLRPDDYRTKARPLFTYLPTNNDLEALPGEWRRAGRQLRDADLDALAFIDLDTVDDRIQYIKDIADWESPEHDLIDLPSLFGSSPDERRAFYDARHANNIIPCLADQSPPTPSPQVGPIYGLRLINSAFSKEI